VFLENSTSRTEFKYKKPNTIKKVIGNNFNKKKRHENKWLLKNCV
jgi:hypothetical protein